MKTILITYRTLVSLLLVFQIHNLRAQMNWGGAENIRESVFLITDRETYCVEESILFKAWNQSADSVKDAEWSKVLYVELITPDGRAIAQGKYQYSGKGCSGELDIPQNALTGNYYLRAYTKWMRNFSPYQYFYKVIRLINPYNADLLQPLYKDHADLKIFSDSITTEPKIDIELEKKEFGTREKVKVKLSSDSVYLNDFVVCIIKSNINQLQKNIASSGENYSFSPMYYPETRGVSISGRIVNEADSTPVQNNPIHLTIFKEDQEILSATSDHSGLYAIALPELEGEFEIYLTTKNNDDGNNSIILIDNDFCTRLINLPYIPFTLSDYEKKIYSEVCKNIQLNRMYSKNNIEAVPIENKGSIPFYGEPEYTLHIDEFIELPTIQDYIYELIPIIGIRKKNNSHYLKVIGNYSDLQYYDPLILIDLLAVYDVNRLLKVYPEKIDRIEVINIPYIRGNKTYGGIVSFFSKEGDLAGIDLPSWGNFIKFKLYNAKENKHFSLPENERIPLERNCLYWNPSISLKKNTITEFEFYTDDSYGEYIILIRGIDKKGSLMVKSESLTVTEPDD